jgi:hypothetical protein
MQDTTKNEHSCLYFYIQDKNIIDFVAYHFNNFNYIL